jgi:hypothetical protein
MDRMTTLPPAPRHATTLSPPAPLRSADDAEAARALAELFPHLQAAADAALAELFPMLRLRQAAARH